MMIAFLAASVLACASALNKICDDNTPYDSGQQLPFEEKEFEDKDDVDEKSTEFTVSLYVIYDQTQDIQFDCSALTIKTSFTQNHRSLFLSNHTLLI